VVEVDGMEERAMEMVGEQIITQDAEVGGLRVMTAKMRQMMMIGGDGCQRRRFSSFD